MALHELCDKYRLTTPKFVTVEGDARKKGSSWWDTTVTVGEFCGSGGSGQKKMSRDLAAGVLLQTLKEKEGALQQEPQLQQQQQQQQQQQPEPQLEQQHYQQQLIHELQQQVERQQQQQQQQQLKQQQQEETIRKISDELIVARKFIDKLKAKCEQQRNELEKQRNELKKTKKVVKDREDELFFQYNAERKRKEKEKENSSLCVAVDDLLIFD